MFKLVPYTTSSSITNTHITRIQNFNNVAVNDPKLESGLISLYS